MQKNRGTLLITGFLLLGFTLLTACNKQTVYNHYEHMLLSGWEKNDTVNFCIPDLSEGGNYTEELGLRINSEYPFMGLQLLIEQEILPSHEIRLDTLSCSLIDNQGNSKGQGLNYYQYVFPLTTINLNKGDRLRISVRHDMKREILPGISDIGFRLTKSN